MPDPAAELRYAIERGEYARAANLWSAWTSELARRREGHAADSAEWERYREAYGWARGVLLAERAHLLDRINTLHAAGAYGAAPVIRAASLVQGSF